ncbi:MAG: HlyD family efflux transporter periplasmic adaptor subunit [Pseudomonadota bacterium]
MKLGPASIGLAVLAVAAGAFVWAFREPPVPVDLATVDRGDVVITVTEDGVAQIREVFTISAPAPGRMLRAPLEVGDLVMRRETIVAVIEPQMPGFLDARQRREAQAEARAAAAAVRLAEAEVARADAEIRYWTAELERNRTLVARNAIAAKTLEQTQLELDVREAAAAQARAGLVVRREDLARAEAALIPPEDDERRSDCCLNVTSPTSGRVLEVYAESATVVATGQPLLDVGDPGDLEVIVDVLSDDAVRIAAGQKALIEDWGGAAPLEGVVRRVYPAGFEKISALGIEEQRVDVAIDLVGEAAARRRLGHEFRVVARIEVERRDEVLRAPLSALFRDDGSWSVFVAEGGAAALRSVDVGARDERHAEILSGLTEGETVVLYPSDRLSDGRRVERRLAEPLVAAD